MIKILTFDADSEHFSIIWQALVLSHMAAQSQPADRREPRSFDQMRREAKIVAAMEDISEPVDPALFLPTGDAVRRIVTSQTATLEQADVDLLQRFIRGIQWKPTATVGAIRTHDWLSSIPSV